MKTKKDLTIIFTSLYLVAFIAFVIFALATNPTHNFNPRPF